jgi:hypothetical protein
MAQTKGRAAEATRWANQEAVGATPWDAGAGRAARPRAGEKGEDACREEGKGEGEGERGREGGRGRAYLGDPKFDDNRHRIT